MTFQVFHDLYEPSGVLQIKYITSAFTFIGVITKL